jgi:hypothetical protein
VEVSTNSVKGSGELDEKEFKANYPRADLRWMDSERMNQQELLHMLEHYLVQTPRARRSTCPTLVDLKSIRWRKFKLLTQEDGTRTNEFCVPLMIAFVASGRLSLVREGKEMGPHQRR